VNPITTQLDYSASDGVNVDAGDVRGLNLLVLTRAQGEPAYVVGAFRNSGTEDVDVVVTVGPTEETIAVPAGTTVLLSGDTALEVTDLDLLPGLLVPITFTVDGTTAEAQVPLKDATFAEYEAALTAIDGGVDDTDVKGSDAEEVEE